MTEATVVALCTVLVITLGGYWYKWYSEMEVALEQRT